MNAVAHATTEQLKKGPIKGTLSDADVKELLVRAAKAKSVFEVHSIIKVFCQNRVALTKVIERLTGELEKRRTAAASSSFDIALLEQLKVVRTELDEANRSREEAISELVESKEKLFRMEQLHDNAQRLAERVQRELRLTSLEREKLSKQNQAISDELLRKSVALDALNTEVTGLRNRLLTTEEALTDTIEKGREIIAERNALRERLANATGNATDLKNKLRGYDRLVADLRVAVKRHMEATAEHRKMIRFLSAEVMTQRYQQRNASPAPADNVPTLSNVVGTSNVVPFASNAELEKLRQQVTQRDNAIAGKDNTIAQLGSANNSMKERLSEVEARVNQVDAELRAQKLANETLANHLLEMLPEDQRAIYSRPSHDASSLMLITTAVKRYLEDQTVASRYGTDVVGHSM